MAEVSFSELASFFTAVWEHLTSPGQFSVGQYEVDKQQVFLGASVAVTTTLLAVCVQLWRRKARAVEPHPTTGRKMKAVVFTSYGGPEVMTVDEDYPVPAPPAEDNVLIRVKAASINVLDLRIREGYMNALYRSSRRKTKLPLFPIMVGRDFSGIVEDVGSKVAKFKPGDEVWGALGLDHSYGSLAEYTICKEAALSHKPTNLTFVEAASFPHVALTSWGALVTSAGMNKETTAGKRVLVHAGTGGVGTFSIQLVKAWGGHVITTCSTSGVELVKSLGADDIIDYKLENFATRLSEEPKLDVVLNTLGPHVEAESLALLKRGGAYATIVTPVVNSMDNYGIVLGLLFALPQKWKTSLYQRLVYGRRFAWAFAYANGEILDLVRQMVEDGKIKPAVENVFSLTDVHKAYEHLARGHARGKTVIKIAD
ncbi:reticulon-4-interacting protein 1 homolog, mitochondrial-like [Branchiostoma floridae]|uniref:Reticulon-4-interacting protein 1 homolog, mitochondrial-like n=1 Tax=Branchiostoma floridae TaxID=7739 RepID=A0A9J7KP01_BRAFL|nr:reticulon-4-interacting protein 1 homolog, mitochondrial-like [Branchiostoma floridae]